MVSGELNTVDAPHQSVASMGDDPNGRLNKQRPSGELSHEEIPRDDVGSKADAINSVELEQPCACNDLEVQFSRSTVTSTAISSDRRGLWETAKKLFQKVSKLRGVHNRQDQVYGSKMRPTNRLILLVVIMSFIMALTVAGTAVGLQWASLTDSRKEALRSQLGLAANAVGSFVSIQRALNSQQTTATIVTNVIKEVGYNANLQTMIKTQEKASKVAGMLIENLYSRVSADKTMFASQLISIMIDHLCSPANDHCDLVPGLVAAINAATWMDYGHSVVVANATSSNSINMVGTDVNGCGVPSCLPALHRTALENAVLQKANGTNSAGDVASYIYSSKSKYAVLYGSKATSLQTSFMNQTVSSINALNSKMDGTVEIMIQTQANPGYPLTTLRFPEECPTGCKNDIAGTRVILGESYAIDQDYRHTSNIVATGHLLEDLNAFFLFEIDLAEVTGEILSGLADANPKINAQLTGSQKLLLGQRVVNPTNGSISYTMLDAAARLQNCKPPCIDQAMLAAVRTCDDGVGRMIDYRGIEVAAAYDCVPELNLAIVLELDTNEIIWDSINQVVSFANDQNAKESSSTELMIDRLDNTSQVSILSKPKDPSMDNAKLQSWAKQSFPAIDALRGNRGLSTVSDYRDTNVLAAYDYSKPLGIGFLLKVDVSEFERPLVMNLLILLFTAVGIALVGVTFVGFFSRRMLSSIEDTWEKGRKAVQEQKENFEHLVGAMYPKFATEKLLAGEVQIVLEVPEASIFFSDICNFTMLSNRLSAHAMIDWIGYVFGVMDHVAEHHKVYKVKTIGDAYFAISGPASLIEGVESKGHTLRMVRFASDCAQIFSGNYAHPDSGQCLKMIAQQSALLKKRAARMASMAPSSISGTSTDATSVSGANGRQFQCMMRYGIAMGPVTMGVLQGKRPMFDVWGKTVNLAARLENGGQPGCVQLCESAYQAVMMDQESHPEFLFDPPHTIFAKGFGNVSSYFVKDSVFPPPRELLNALSLETSVGSFNFVAQQYQHASRGTGSQAKSQPKSLSAFPVDLVVPKVGEPDQKGVIADLGAPHPLQVVEII